MRWRAPLSAALLVLLTVPATGLGWFRQSVSRSSYLAAPATVYYCPAPVAVAVIPAAVQLPVVPAPAMPPAALPRYAEPRPAPPSGSTAEPPRAPEATPKPGVNAQESRKAGDKFYDSYFVAGGAPPAGERCAVMFWNLSGQGLTLTVDGQQRLSVDRLPTGSHVLATAVQPNGLTAGLQTWQDWPGRV